jgi:hypothetical protein
LAVLSVASRYGEITVVCIETNTLVIKMMGPEEEMGRAEGGEGEEV